MFDNALIIVCSRLKSSRIPQKAFKKICGVPAIERILKICHDTGIDTVLAVPDTDINEYAPLVKKYGVFFFSGNNDSPLHRMAESVKMYSEKKWIIRITHDDILIDEQTIKELLSECMRQNADYGYTPEIIEGAGVEIIRADNLIAAAEKRKTPTEFISYFVSGPDKRIVKYKPRGGICRPYRLTMDYPEDCVLLETIFRGIKNPTADKICSFLDNNSYLLTTNKTPDITFYTCAYNSAEFIGTAIRSVLSVDYSSMEYLIIDDCSSDNTLLEAAKFASDKRMRIIVNETNHGLAYSSNRAIDSAKGKYVCRVDADDILMSKIFSSSFSDIRRMIDSGLSIIYPAYYELYQDGGASELCRPDRFHHAGCAVMNKRDLNEMRFRDDLRHWDGLELYKRINQTGKVGYFNDPTWLYRKRETSMSSTNLPHRAKMKAELGL